MNLDSSLLKRIVTLAALLASTPAFAQDPIVTENPDGTTTVSPSTPSGREAQPATDPSDADLVLLNFAPDTSIYDLVLFFAQTRDMNFVIGDVKELQGKKVTIISNRRVPGRAAWEAFLSALEVAGYSLSTVGNTSKIVKSSEAGQKPIRIGVGQPGASDGYVTQLIQLENTRVDDMSKVIQTMAPGDAKIVAYPPTNTLIITDTAANIRKMYRIMNELDVAAPRSSMEIYELIHASSSEVKGIIEELYGTQENSQEAEPASRVRRTSRSSRASSRRSRTTSTSTDTVSAGTESKYISKVLDDERTNSLIVLANQDGHKAVRELIKKLDVDTDPTAGSQIHVVTLENAKAEEVATIMSQLSQEGSSNTGTDNRSAAARRAAARANARGQAPAAETGEDEERGAIAAFDSGMRIAADENTNSLVIIADNDDFKIVKSVIDMLDIERKQVFVDAVVMELSSEDTETLGLAYHLPQQPSADATGFVGSQLGATSLGLTQDALSGLAFGVFGQTVDVPVINPTTGLTEALPVPSFGIALNAIKTFGSTNIISNPTLTTLDNEEAQITVGRKIPFPTTSGLNNLGQPVVSFQREDVAISLKVTPRINSANFVTLELEVEVQEVEESAQSAAVTAAGGGFITSERTLQTVALVRDNQTMVIGGLVSSTEGQSESKVPILGDLPILGALFRSRGSTERKSNLMIFLTPHIIDDPDDMLEIQRVKEAQRQEFLRRFYGRSRDDQMQELKNFLRFSMNFVDEPTMYRGPTEVSTDLQLSDETRSAIQAVIDDVRGNQPGAGAGALPPEGEVDLVIEDRTEPTDEGEE
ncbi:MAG: type II secretion system secretin GspD [Myxococcales bacterium]|nr:type II secretion system secretin GspD [Myxococcales bacterium]